MPTPSEADLPPSPLSDDARSTFASCPPEEREPALVNPAEVLQEEHERTQQPTPEPETQSSSSDDDSTRAKTLGEEAVHECSSLGTSDADTHPSQSASTQLCSPDCDAQLLHARERSRPGITTSFLRPGSQFRGTQRSDRQVYDVQVEIKDVNVAESFLCGYLRIQGLTDDHPTLTTFFEGEIIGPKHLFKTTNPSWGSTEKVDLLHWSKFPAWRSLTKSAKSPNFTLKNYQQREHLFMRWKEYFLVPDHRVKTITGASFEGFYYICFNQCDGSVSGIYFHAKSEKYQQLELSHVDDRGRMSAVEFR